MKTQVQFDTQKDNSAGYIILMRYYNSKEPYSKLSYWHAYVGRNYTHCNDIRTLVHGVWACVWEMRDHTFARKKDAVEYLKQVRNEIESNDPVSFNSCKTWFPDRFFYKIVKVKLSICAEFSEK